MHSAQWLLVDGCLGGLETRRYGQNVALCQVQEMNAACGVLMAVGWNMHIAVSEHSSAFTQLRSLG